MMRNLVIKRALFIFLLVIGVLAGIEAWHVMRHPSTSLFLFSGLFVAGPVYWALFVWLWLKYDLTGPVPVTTSPGAASEPEEIEEWRRSSVLAIRHSAIHGRKLIG
ncbi:hypothetical protein [Paludibaculum fermentans]|uniref:Uncharacterized protein n=1 Tax=Paludibaculum fermentans TaxID=1473598 RepID=A0A7S7NT48_PALFE|nr:hypothetical protein [Paludibaculum fermentans]QOY88754.1 hypothetical protein IRI77_01965 [Paludibaculum fermentans]